MLLIVLLVLKFAYTPRKRQTYKIIFKETDRWNCGYGFTNLAIVVITVWFKNKTKKIAKSVDRHADTRIRQLYNTSQPASQFCFWI